MTRYANLKSSSHFKAMGDLPRWIWLSFRLLSCSLKESSKPMLDILLCYISVYFPTFAREISYLFSLPDRVAKSVMCLATDASLTADPGFASSIPTRSNTFVETAYEIISTVILLPTLFFSKIGKDVAECVVCDSRDWRFKG